MVDGSTYEVVRSSAETNGEYVEMIFHLPPESVAPPPHVHEELTEEYEVIEGTFDVSVAGEWKTLGPGDSASVAPGVLHTFKNRSGDLVRVRNWHRPAARFEDYIEHISRLLAAKGIKRGRDPRIPIYLSMVMLEYPETISPGRARERVAINAVARIGRLLRFNTDA
jgi:mannose-6-phosphate isomerase-like protein (cupin superfamily)